MGRQTLYWLVTLTLLFFPNYSFSQFFLYSEAPVDIEASFTRQSIEAYAQQTFFNVLKIKNNNNRAESLNLSITVPEGWAVIGKEKLEINLSPLDSLVIPIRVAIGGNVRGDIGYNVIASISDSRGNTVKNEYCYIKIPRKADLSVSYSSRLYYIDPVSNSAEFSIVLKNRGNREELVNFLLNGNSFLGIGYSKEPLSSVDVNIPPYTDTLFTYRVFLRESEQFGRDMFGLNIKVSSLDASYENYLWFRRLETLFKNEVPSNEKPLYLEFYAQGLLDEHTSPNYSLQLEGKTLFNGNKDIFYYYRNYSSREPKDFYKTNQMRIGATLESFTIEIGDTYRSIESNMSGRGASIAYGANRVNAELVANKNLISETNNMGGTLLYNLTPSFYVNSGFVYNDKGGEGYNSKLGFIGSGFTLMKSHRFDFRVGLNSLQRNLNGKSSHQEYGWQFNYISNLKNFSSYIRAQYGSELYNSPYAGKFQLFSNLTWRKNPFNHFQLFYNENINKRSRIQGTTYTHLGEASSKTATLRYRHFFSSNVELNGGPIVENNTSEGLSVFTTDKKFSSFNYKIAIGARVKNSLGTVLLTPSLELARAYMTSNPFAATVVSGNSRRAFNFYHLSLTLRTRSLMVLGFFTSGARSAYDQINFLRTGIQSRRLQFMPSYDDFVYKDIVKVRLGLNYTNDMISKSRYSNITGQANWYLPKDWEIQFLGVYSLQNRINYQDLLEAYQTFYLEFAIKKEFNIPQPRVKYNNIEFVFFKDYNGNFVQEENEPGIKNILVNIEKVSTEVIGDIPGEFFGTDLLSDNLGRVKLDRIPEGIYKINYNLLGNEASTFSKAITESEFVINKSGQYLFPFVEKNKVFGKIILNRSRLSGLGRLDLSNVRVTATDSQGRSHSTLTDRNGEFVLFAPITDEYIVTINNIYYENFDLRQNSFLVQFNGYKQFEVNFVFDEKVRRINFAANDENMQQGVQQVRRTTISGSVKDANTQQAIRAKVNLINTRTNAIVASVNSSATSGDYTLNFMASDDYLLEVLADDYWYFSENLVLQQVTTFMNINRNIQLKPISVGSSIELNIQFGANSDYLAPESVAELNRLLRQVRNNPTVRLEIQGHCDDLEAIQKPDIGRDRAGAVAKYLIENGFSNVEVKDMKNNVPLTSNDTEEGRARNRRIDVVVLRR